MRIRRATLLAAAAAVAVLGAGSVSWACVPVATISATPEALRAGEEVTISGIRFLTFSPVVIRLHGLDGPIMATIEMNRASNTLFKTTFTIPPGTAPGPLVVVAEQAAQPEHTWTNWGVPARTLLTVLDAAGNAPPAPKPAALARPGDLDQQSVSAGTFVLVALGVAAAALLVLGVAALVAGREPRPAAVPAAEAERRSET